MFQTASGVTIPFPERMEEKYNISGNRIQFNLSFEKLGSFLYDFLTCLQEPLFLIIHAPINEKEENELRKSPSDPFHSEVLYLDGQGRKQIHEILGRYGEILLNDGMSEFGIASHETEDEIFIQKYKLTGIFSKEPNRYIHLLDKYGVTPTAHLVTVWDTVSRDHPGKRSRVVVHDKDIYDVVNELKQIGMYRARIVEG